MRKIPVRFVPRGPGIVDPAVSRGMAPEGAPKQLIPTEGECVQADRALRDRKVGCTQSAMNRLSTELDEATFRDVFKNVEIEERPTRGDSGSLGYTPEESYVAPRQGLEIPDALKDSVAFAYVPRPVEFYAPHAVPPAVDFYHLRLADVQLKLNAARCHRQGWTGEGVNVAVVDTGFMVHPWFIENGFRLRPTGSLTANPPQVDLVGHGTAMAANVFAAAPGCSVLGLKAKGAPNEASDEEKIISASDSLELGIATGAGILSCSWGLDLDKRSWAEFWDHDLNEAREALDIEMDIEFAAAQGMTILFATGNGQKGFPSAHWDVIGVGGVTVNENGSLAASNDASAFESQLYPNRSVPGVCGISGRFGGEPEIAHIMLPTPPGTPFDGWNLPGDFEEPGWGAFSGTSSACAQVAGVCALLKQIKPDLKPREINAVLQETAVDVREGRARGGAPTGPARDLATGAGLVDAFRACQHVRDNF